MIDSSSLIPQIFNSILPTDKLLLGGSLAVIALMPIAANSQLVELLIFASFHSLRQAAHLAQVNKGYGSSRDLR